MPGVHASTKKIRRKIKHLCKLPVIVSRNWWFAQRYRHLKNTRKILYAITPPPRWKDIGDHAQVIAIRDWLDKHYPGIPVLEMDKDRARYFLPALKRLVRPDDLILLHSGGNMGDRAMWSESIRRLIIQSFPRNKIVSLPQTIFFSDTERGCRERENTRSIYREHPNLTIIARDPKSEEYAHELFDRAQIFSLPDFVLSLKPSVSHHRNVPPEVLLVLRDDNESFLTGEQRQALVKMITYPSTRIDNVHHRPIREDERRRVLDSFLEAFCRADVVVTDRFHGLIFSVICRTPCVALRSIDHKILSGHHWFSDVPFVRFADGIDEVNGLLEECLAADSRDIPDYNERYFDRLPELIDW